MGQICLNRAKMSPIFLLVLQLEAIIASNAIDDDKHNRPEDTWRNSKSTIFFETGKTHDVIPNVLNKESKSATDSDDVVQVSEGKPVSKTCEKYLNLLVSMPNTYQKCEGVKNCSCRNHQIYGQIVDCSHRNINKTRFPNDTSVLILSGCQIEDVTYGPFRNLHSLKYLDISRNKIHALSNSSFLGLQGLCILKLNGNLLIYTKEFIPNDCFMPLINLIYLDLQQCLNNISKEEEYPSVAISALINLQVLQIDGLNEKHFQEEFSRLHRLSNLSLIGGRCQMNEIGKDKFVNFPVLKSLSVVNCNVARVENESFVELSSLDSLDLSYNTKLTFASLANITFALRQRPMYLLNFTKIHPTFGECTRLEATNMQYMKGMTIENLVLDSNRLAVTTIEVARYYIPKLTGMLSVQDNLLLLGQYTLWFLCNTNLATLKTFNLAGQMINHNLSDLILPYQKAIDSQAHHSSKKKNTTFILNQTEKRRIVKRGIAIPCINYDKLTNGVCYPIPKGIQNIDVSRMKSRYPLRGICFCEPNSLRKIDLHSNIFYRIEGNISGLSKVEWIDFSSNFCENISAQVFQSLPGLHFLNLSNNYLGYSFKKDTDGNIFRMQSNLRTLDLSDNRIRSLKPKFFSGLLNIENLFLRYNLLTEFEVDLKRIEKLKYLDLSINFLHRFSDNMIQDFERLAGNNLTIDLSKNNFSCSCNHLNVLKWLSESKIRFISLKKYTCTDEVGHVRNMSNAFELYTELSNYCKSYTLLIIISSSAFVLFSIIVTLCILYRYRWNLRYIYYSGKMRMKGFIPIKDDDNDFDHDVFVSFANENNSFVRDFAIPELEEKRQLRLLLHDRDFRPGEFVHDNIVKAICTSKKTLIVMSDAFLQSIWCRFEMHMARMEAIKTGRNVLTVVLLEDVPTTGLPLEIVDVIRRQTFLEFPRENAHREQFWERLSEALK